MFLSKYYQLIRANLKENSGLVHILKNFSWLFFDKIIQLGVGLWITSWLARYLGPEQFGIWNYVLAFITVASAFSTLGLDTIVIRDITKSPADKNRILGTAFFLKVLSAFLAMISCMIVSHLIPSHTALIKLLICVMSTSFLFQSFDVIDSWFRSQMQSQYVVYARNASFLISASLKIWMIINHFPLIAFAFIFSLEIILAALLLVFFYVAKEGDIAKWKIDKEIAGRLLKSGWPLFLAYISSILYMRMDQIMIGQMLNERAVGIYSVALRIYEIPFAILVLVTSVAFPKIVEIYEKDKGLFFKRYRQITSLYTLSSLFLVFGLIFCGKPIISFLFGNNYTESYLPLILLSMGLVFIYNGMLRSSYLAVSHNEKIILYTSTFSAVLNITLNYFLIKTHGIAGAAMATLITHFISLFLLNYVFKATKPIFAIQLEAFYKFKF